VCETIYSLLGSGIPHYVQNFFDALHTDAQHRDTDLVSADDADRVFRQDMLSVRGTSELEHYESRLKQVLGEALYTLALDMLTQTAVSNTLSENALLAFKIYYQDQLENIDDSIKTVLYVLEHDGYLYSHKNGCSFVLNLLKEWWLARHKIFYTPIEDRIK
jgi:hypothetical protein